MFVLAQVRACRQRREHGFAVEDFEVGFLKDFVGLQGLLLFAIVMNGFRGIPLSLVILGVVALLVYVVTQHTPFGRYLYAIGDNEEAAAAFGHSDPEGRDWHLRPIGWGRRVDGFYADGLCRSLDDDGGRSDGTRRDRRVRDRGYQSQGGPGHGDRRIIRCADHDQSAQWHDAIGGSAGDEIYGARRRIDPRGVDGCYRRQEVALANCVS